MYILSYYSCRFWYLFARFHKHAWLCFDVSHLIVCLAIFKAAVLLQRARLPPSVAGFLPRMLCMQLHSPSPHFCCGLRKVSPEDDTANAMFRLWRNVVEQCEESFSCNSFHVTEGLLLWLMLSLFELPLSLGQRSCLRTFRVVPLSDNGFNSSQRDVQSLGFNFTT